MSTNSLSSTQRNPTSHNNLNEAAQRERREKNNQAVKKCRAARRLQEKQTLEDVKRMQEMNRILKKEFEQIKNEIDLLNELLTFCNNTKT